MFYTYIWRAPDGAPFYVGKGSGGRAKQVIGRSSDFLAIHAQGGCTVDIVDEFILESQAHAHEMALIERYGRREYGGLLVNKTDGGEGSSGAVHTFESRAKISAGNKGLRRTTETRERMSAARLGMKLTPEHCANISAGKRNPSATTRAKLSARRASPETRAKISAAVSNPSEETRVALSTAARMSPPRRGGFKGVYFEAGRAKWAARIFMNDKQAFLGRFATPEDAARAYDAAAIAAWGAGNCYLNLPEEHLN